VCESGRSGDWEMGREGDKVTGRWDYEFNVCLEKYWILFCHI